MFANFFWNSFHRNDDSASWRWALSMALCLGFMATFGSFLSGYYIFCAIGAWIYYFMDRRRFAFSRRDRIIGGIFLSYLTVTALFGVLHPGWSGGLISAGQNIVFLIALPLLPVLRDAYRPYWSKWLKLGLGFGGIFCGLAVSLELAIWQIHRAELVSGNPLVLAYVSGAVALFNLFYVLNGPRHYILLHMAAVFGNLWALVASGGRGALMVLLFIAAVFILIKASALIRRRPGRGSVVVIAGLIALSVFGFALHNTSAFHRIESRFFDLWNSVSQKGDVRDPSISVRLSMLESGIAAFAESPLTGHGRQNVVDAANRQFPDDLPIDQSHLHNAFLTEAVASGVYGLIAYCLVLLTPIVAARGLPVPYRHAAYAFSAFTAGAAFTNIGFYHDITTAYFCLVVTILGCMPRPGSPASA